MSSDQKSKTLAVGNSNGFVIIFSCCIDGREWKPLHSVQPSEENPVVSLGTLNRGENIYVAGFTNGEVKLISTIGHLLCEIGAHSR